MSSLLFHKHVDTNKLSPQVQVFQESSANETIMLLSLFSIPFNFFLPQSRRVAKSGEYSEDTCFAQVFYFIINCSLMLL